MFGERAVKFDGWAGLAEEGVPMEKLKPLPNAVRVVDGTDVLASNEGKKVEAAVPNHRFNGKETIFLIVIKCQIFLINHLPGWMDGLTH